MHSVRESRVFMSTVVTVQGVAAEPEDGAAREAVHRAFGWFAEVEARCSRFLPESELRRLCAQAGRPVPVSPLLYQALQFALAVAEDSGGAFDPTVGVPQEARGFDREHRTGRRRPSGLPDNPEISWRDVTLDAAARSVTLQRPLLLDLGAVAKGLAIDLALQELRLLAGGAVEAGGDIAVCGLPGEERPWRVGIRHPRRPDAVCADLALTGGAVCTSGDYERRSPDGGSHLWDPRRHRPAAAVASCTVVAANAMLADALSTAACVLGPARAVPWLQARGVEALLLTPDLQSHVTSGFERLVAAS